MAARGARAAAGADATDRLPAGCTTARARPRGIPARACQSRLGARTQFRAGHAMGRRKCRPSAGACGGPGECWGRRHPGGRRYHHARRASRHDRHSDRDGRGPDPFVGGLVKSLARPGGNVTGFSSTQADIEGKGLEIFKDMVPGLARVAVLVPRIARNLFASAQEGAAKALGIDLLYIDLPGPEAAGTAMRQVISTGAQGALMRVGPFFSSSQRQAIVDLAAELRLPVMYERREYIEQGGLLTYVPDIADLYRRAAGYIVAILAGANPGDLPIEQPTKFELL